MISHLFVAALLLAGTSAKAQQGNQFINDRIQNIFSSQQQQRPNLATGMRGGFGEIVTPEPLPGETFTIPPPGPGDNLPPTQKPVILTTGNQVCRCVPYFRCAPENNPSRIITTDSRFFGEIDVRCEATEIMNDRIFIQISLQIQPTVVSRRPRRLLS